MANRIQLRRGTAADWTAKNPVLADGEPGIETDTGKAKYGDGVTVWAALPYAAKGDPGPAGVVDDASVATALEQPLTKAALSGTIEAQVGIEGTPTRRALTAGLAGGTSRRQMSGGSVISQGAVLAMQQPLTTWPAAGLVIGNRFTLTESATFSSASLPAGASAGNVEAGIYALAGSPLAGAGQYGYLVATSGVTPMPASVQDRIRLDFLDPVSLAPGEYAAVLWCNNATAEFKHTVSTEIKALAVAIDGTTAQNSLPTLLTGQYIGGRTVAIALIKQTEVSRGLAVLFGDSITENPAWFDIANAMRGGIYPNAINSGIGGNTTAAMLARIQPDVIAHNPDLVTVMGGTNSIAQGHTTVQVISQLDQIIEAILTQTSADIVLGTITPRNFIPNIDPDPSVARPRINEINAWIRGQAGGRIAVADWAGVLSVSGDGQVPNLDYFSDHVHPGYRGAALMAGVVAPLL